MREIPSVRARSIASGVSGRAATPTPESTSSVHGVLLGVSSPVVKCRRLSAISLASMLRVGTGAFPRIRPG
jgi:hypothetical protein